MRSRLCGLQNQCPLTLLTSQFSVRSVAFQTKTVYLLRTRNKSSIQIAQQIQKLKTTNLSNKFNLCQCDLSFKVYLFLLDREYLRRCTVFQIE